MLPNFKFQFISRLNKLAPDAVVLYPGRHPESRHDLEVLERNRTALYRLEDSPWNKAVCDYVHTQLERMKTQAEIRGNGNSNGAVDAKPTKQIVIGVIGAGNIGSRVAQRAAIEGKRVLYHSRSAKPHLDEMGAMQVEVDELLAQADEVVVSVPRTQETHGMLSARALAHMKDDARLVSISHSDAIVERDLWQRMMGSHMSVTLDIASGSVDDALRNRLMHEGRLHITPHIAYKSETSTGDLVGVLALPLMHMSLGNLQDRYFVDPTAQSVTMEDESNNPDYYPLVRVV